MMLAVRVPSRSAEEARALISEVGILDKHHRILNEDGYTEIPILQKPGDELIARFEKLGASVIDEREYTWRETFKDVHREILAMIEMPEEAKPKLPRRWELLGHVLVLKFGNELEQWKDQVAGAYGKVLGADTVLRDTGGVRGLYREPVMERLMGENTETIHVENGIKYCLDAARLMFSSGNVNERIRMASVCEPGEVVVDMFAGIGYFALPMAVHSRPGRIIAHEINPLAFEYLKKNMELNGVCEVMEPVLGDCMEAGEGMADRAVMGYVGNTHEFLTKAMRILKGTGIIHYHETCPDRLMPERPARRVRVAAEETGKTAETINQRTIKSYAPGVSHVVVDAKINS